MAETYDIVFAGAGHNGLTAACYLAKAGFSVCMCEQSDMVGGGVKSREGLTAPGFISDPASTIHVTAQASPIIRDDELGLFKNYGLKYIYPEAQMCIHFTDGTTLGIYKSLQRTCDSIAQFSQKDAEAYRNFAMMAEAGAGMILQGFFSPPPSYGMFASMMDTSDEGRELMRYMFLSVQDVINEWFEHPKTRIALTRWISEIMVNPNTKGTGIMVFVMLGMAHAEPGGGMPVGGSGALSQAMERFIKDNGGTIRLNSTVKKFIVSGGEAKGVELEDGEQIFATKMVVGNLNIKQVFPGMVDDPAATPEFVHRVQRLKPAFSAFNQSLALNEMPHYVCDDPTLNDAFLTEFAPCDPDEYGDYFTKLDRGILPGHFPLISVQSVHDSTRAPEGKHVMYFYEYAPYNLRDGGPGKWDEIREEYAQGMIDFVKPYVTNLDADNIIGQYIQSPLDLSRLNPSFIDGDFAHIASYMEQFMGNRPLPGYNFRTPIDKLYLCGPSQHPGSGCSCGGRAAAVAILEALGTSIENVVG